MCEMLLPELEDLELCPLCEIESQLDVEMHWRNWKIEFRECPSCALYTVSLYHYNIFDSEILDNWGMTAFGKDIQNKGALIDQYMQKTFYEPWGEDRIFEWIGITNDSKK